VTVAELKFGHWPRKSELNAGATIVRPLPNYDDVVAAVQGSDRVINGWYYPPLAAERIYKRVYCLDSTHSLGVAPAPGARQWSEFVIALLGLLDGLRLIPEGWVHFYRTAVKLNSLSDVICRVNEIEQVLQIAESFWRSVTEHVRRLSFGAIHWRLFSESYEHEFERFNGQYAVLDTCYRIHCKLTPGGKGEPPHSKRAEFLAGHYSMETPSWAKTRMVNGRLECDLSKLRNELVHEARYAGRPIGFEHPGLTVPIDLTLGYFNTRLILALLGVKCAYVRSSVETRSQFALDLDRSPGTATR
jgi:hypothetical protein